MPLTATAPFDALHEQYDAWFERHDAAYLSELLAVRALLPAGGLGLEVGLGTARFAAPLGVRVGVDPSMEMLARAARRGTAAVRAVAEALPFGASAFDHVLIVTTICFVDEARLMLTEAARVLKPGAPVVIGFIDRESPIGAAYLARQAQSPFYRHATFFSAAEVDYLLRAARFARPAWVQTLFRPLDQISEIQPVRPGRGEGSFVVVRAQRGG